MKHLLLLFILISWIPLFGQDTIAGYARYDGTSTYILSNGIDTFNVHNYANGEREAKITYASIQKRTIYERFYPNGTRMWTKEMLWETGTEYAAYYNEKGKRVAEFTYLNDSIIDTIFITKKCALLFGKMTYTSVVHGGMMREDGSSNISRSSGNRAHIDMYTVKMNSRIEKQEIYKSFRTDVYGDFFLCLEEGEFGFFDSRFDINMVRPTMGSPLSSSGKSMSANWSLDSPVEIKKGIYNFLKIHYSSVGYAP